MKVRVTLSRKAAMRVKKRNPRKRRKNIERRNQRERKARKIGKNRVTPAVKIPMMNKCRKIAG